MALIDTDSHVVEPPDLWTSRMSKKKWGDNIPHVERAPWVDGSETDMWVVGGQPFITAIYGVFTNAESGDEPVRMEDAGLPKSFYEQHPSSFDAAERIKVLDAGGIQAAALYPNVGLFQMGNLGESLGAEFQDDIVRAYNDFLLDWISPDPTRFIPIAQIPYWDVDESVKEIERVAALGFPGICTSATPHQKGLPILGDPHWDPLWAAAQANGLSINFHAGSGQFINPEEIRNRMQVEKDLMMARLGCSHFLNNGIALADLLFSGVLPRYPDLKFVNVEGGIGYIPFLLEAADYHFQRSRVSDRPEMEMLPSEYFHRQVYSNYWFEKLETWQVDAIGADNILFETDYPHPTCIYGSEVDDAVEANVSHLPAEVREKVLWKNAAALYRIAA